MGPGLVAGKQVLQTSAVDSSMCGAQQATLLAQPAAGGQQGGETAHTQLVDLGMRAGAGEAGSDPTQADHARPLQRHLHLPRPCGFQQQAQVDKHVAADGEAGRFAVQRGQRWTRGDRQLPCQSRAQRAGHHLLVREKQQHDRRLLLPSAGIVPIPLPAAEREVPDAGLRRPQQPVAVGSDGKEPAAVLAGQFESALQRRQMRLGDQQSNEVALVGRHLRGEEAGHPLQLVIGPVHQRPRQGHCIRRIGNGHARQGAG